MAGALIIGFFFVIAFIAFVDTTVLGWFGKEYWLAETFWVNPVRDPATTRILRPPVGMTNDLHPNDPGTWSHVLGTDHRGRDIAVRLFAAGEDVRRLEGPEELRFEAESSALLERPRRVVEGLRTSSVRLLLSDFMSPIDPAAVIRPYAEGSSLLLAVRLLGPWEADPDPSGPVELVDREAGRSRQMNVEASAVEDYRRRLRRLTDALEDEISKSGGRFVDVTADRALEDVLRDDFLPAGLVEVC